MTETPSTREQVEKLEEELKSYRDKVSNLERQLRLLMRVCSHEQTVVSVAEHPYEFGGKKLKENTCVDCGQVISRTTETRYK